MDEPEVQRTRAEGPWSRLEKYSILELFGGSVVLAAASAVGILVLLLTPVLEAGMLALMVIGFICLILFLPLISLFKRIKRRS